LQATELYAANTSSLKPYWTAIQMEHNMHPRKMWDMVWNIIIHVTDKFQNSLCTIKNLIFGKIASEVPNMALAISL
jgi:hypothetical protein